MSELQFNACLASGADSQSVLVRDGRSYPISPETWSKVAETMEMTSLARHEATDAANRIGTMRAQNAVGTMRAQNAAATMRAQNAVGTMRSQNAVGTMRSQHAVGTMRAQHARAY